MFFSFVQADEFLVNEEYTLTEIIDIAKEVADFDYSTQTIEGNKLHKRFRAKLARELEKLGRYNPQYMIRRPNHYTTLYPKEMVRELFSHPLFENYIEQIKNETTLLDAISRDENKISSPLMRMIETLTEQQIRLIAEVSQLTDAIKTFGFPLNSRQYKTFMDQYSEIEVKVYAVIDVLREYRFPIDEYTKTPLEIQKSREYMIAKQNILNFLNN